MPRRIVFDYEHALDQATRLFWKQGYTETGLRDLLAVMGIGEGSFYNTFGGKQKLFALCLARYQETIVAPRFAALAEPATAGEGLRAFFVSVLDQIESADSPSRMCMVAALASESVLSDARLEEQASAGIAELRGALRSRLLADEAAGILPAGVHAIVAADVLTTFTQGIWRIALLGYPRAEWEAQIETLLTGMGFTGLSRP